MPDVLVVIVMLLVFGPSVLAIFALLRAREAAGLAQKVALLERRLAEFEAARAVVPSVVRTSEPTVAERESPAPVMEPTHARRGLRADEIASREAERALPLTTPLPRPRAEIELAKPLPRALPPRKAIDWERWIGVWGAAAGAGIALALGLILLFRHSIEQGWITPGLRVALGALSGVACITGAVFARRKELRYVPDALAGAGTVALYASAWASYRLYALVPFAVSFAAMVLVTALCIALALRLRTQMVALLGLAGGFATPLLLDADVDRPLSLFGYLLLLDVGLLVVASRRRWPVLGLLGLGATFAYEVLWTLLHVDAQEVPLALAIAGVFALLFSFAGGKLDGSQGLAARAGGLLLPVLLALHFGRSPDLAPSLWPTALLVALLACGSAVVARRMDAAWLSASSAGGAFAVVFTWFARAERTGATQIEFCAVAVGLALLFQGFAEWDRRRGREGERALPPETLVAIGFFLMTLVATGAKVAPPFSGPWALAATWVALALILARQSRPGIRLYPMFAGAVGTGTGLALWANYHGAAPGFPGAPVFASLVLVVAAIAFAAARFAPLESRRVAWHAAGAMCVPLLAGLPGSDAIVAEPLALALFLALALAMALVSVPTRVGAWSLVAVVLCALAQGAVRREVMVASTVDPIGDALALSALSALSVLVFVALPLAVGFPEEGKLGGARASAFRAAALAPLLWFVGLREIGEYYWGDPPDGLVPAVLGVVALGALAIARRTHEPSRRVAVVWLAASGAFLLAIAVPLQVDRHVPPVAAAATGFALACLWRKLDHPGLKYLALPALFVATCGTVISFAGGSGFARAPWPVFDWAGYGALLPGVLLIAASLLLGAREVERLRPFETIYVVKRPLASAVAGIGGLLAIFTWINLEIFDHFGSGSTIEIDLVGRDPQRDLTLSIAWALYALGILSIGMLRKQISLRWASLAFLILSLGKVFLHDLGELEGLFRVASLCGLALSLLLVSVLYQRFVFRAASYADHTTL